MTANSLKSKVDKFLSCKTIAVVGVSGSNDQEAANYNFKKLKSLGYEVFPVNPYLQVFDGQKCYSSVTGIAEKIEGALIFTHPDITPKVVEECYEKGIPNLWIHRAFGRGSCSDGSSGFMKDKQNVNFIDGACPMMFLEKADWAHKTFYYLMKLTGKLPA